MDPVRNQSETGQTIKERGSLPAVLQCRATGHGQFGHSETHDHLTSNP